MKFIAPSTSILLNVNKDLLSQQKTVIADDVSLQHSYVLHQYSLQNFKGKCSLIWLWHFICEGTIISFYNIKVKCW